MGRRKKKGLSYFPLDCGLFTDRRIRRLIGKFGSDGVLLYIYILCECYTNGYFVPYSDTFLDDVAADLGCSAEKTALMVSYLLDTALLDRTLFDTAGVLSSHGIQAQFQECCKGLKRDVEVDGRLWILRREETLDFIRLCAAADFSGINQDTSGKNGDSSGNYAQKEKETKRKENENDRESERERAPGQAPAPPSQQEIEAYCAQMGYKIDPRRFYAYYTDRGFPADWQACMARWNETEFPYRRAPAAPDPAAGQRHIDMDYLHRVYQTI